MPPVVMTFLFGIFWQRTTEQVRFLHSHIAVYGIEFG
jgi:hypothetical protein